MAEKKEKKKEQVIAAAREVMLQVGISKLTLEDVAERIGMAIPSLYYYFSSKQKLLEGLMDAEVERLLLKMRVAVDAAQGPEEKLLSVGQSLVEELRCLYDYPGFTRENSRKAEELVPGPLKRLRETHRKMLEDILREGHEQGVFEVEDIELISFILAAGTYGVVQTMMDPGTPRRLMTDAHVVENMLMNGLKKR